MTYILFIIGIIVLIKGADYLVEGSSSLAKKLGVPTIIIGLTIVAFGTSMPELIVNIMAALHGVSDVAFGNIIGSNIANILLILGVSSLIYPLRVHSSTVWREIPFSLLAVLVLVVFASASSLDKVQSFGLLRSQGVILLFFFVIFLYYVFALARVKKESLDGAADLTEKLKGYQITVMIVGGLVGLYVGGQWVVNGAVALASVLGLSQYLISATIIALGTSLPELVTAVVAARKKSSDLAIGNVVGSNIFNIFWILGVTAIIAPLVISSSAIVDLIILGGITTLLFIFMFIGKKHQLDRWQGIVFLVLYVLYVALLVYRG